MSDQTITKKILDLFNFDLPENRHNRYILTSPRSLQACAKLGIKPVELLPQPPDELLSSCGALSSHALEALHTEVELQRKAKLQATRRERERLIVAATRRERKTRVSLKTRPPSMSPVCSRERKECGHVPVEKARSNLPEKDARLVSALTLHYSSEEAHGRYRAADMEDRWQQQEALLAENISYMQQKAAEKKKNEYEKERQHQERYQRLLEEEEELRQASGEYSSDMLQRAGITRASIAQQAALKRKVKLETKQKMFETRQKELTDLATEENRHRREDLGNRFSLSAERYSLQKHLRRDHMTQFVENERGRACRRKEAAAQMDREVEEWRRELMDLRTETQRRAEEARQRLKSEREWRMKEQGERRSLEHSQNIKRVHEEELQRLKQLQMEVEGKERKRESLDRDRQLKVQKGRELACVSAAAWKQLKEQYPRNSLAAMMQVADQYSHLMHRPRTR